MEVGWVEKEVAAEVNGDRQAIERVEAQIVEMVEYEIGKCLKDMKMFTRAIGRKGEGVVREGWLRPMFARWKRNCHLPTLLSTSKKDLTPHRGHLIDEPFG